MLDGQIDVKSEVKKGTEVKITLPLTRSTTHQPDSVLTTTASDEENVHRGLDGSIDILKQRAQGKTIALYGFDIDKKPSQRSSLVQNTLSNYVTD
jgi:hypothetical protein